jgi:hypothetical protein
MVCLKRWSCTQFRRDVRRIIAQGTCFPSVAQTGQINVNQAPTPPAGLPAALEILLA